MQNDEWARKRKTLKAIENGTCEKIHGAFMCIHIYSQPTTTTTPSAGRQASEQAIHATREIETEIESQ